MTEEGHTEHLKFLFEQWVQPRLRRGMHLGKSFTGQYKDNRVGQLHAAFLAGAKANGDKNY